MVRKSRINLDTLFGHIYNNIVGEPLKPQRIAIFYLIRQLFRTHFGYRAVPSTRPFTPREKTRIFTHLFGLILYHNDISYEDFRRIVRYMDQTIRRNIYYPFVISMEKLATGELHVDMRVEDSLHNGKREYHHLSLYDLPPAKPMFFLTNKSYVYIWVRRVVGQWSRSTQQEMFEITEAMRTWLVPERYPFDRRVRIELPYEIDCSTRARIWVVNQIQSIQMHPSRAKPFEETMRWCEMIRKRHQDVFAVHLLETVVHVQRQCAQAAIEAINSFFDVSMLKINDSVVNASQSHRLAMPCQKPLRFAPLLHGRVCRIFGDRRMAQSVLSESVQQAQNTHDESCNRMANIELAAIEVLQAGPLLELVAPFDESNEPVKKDRRVVQANMHKGAEMDEQTSPDAFPNDPEEGYELHEQLISMAKMLSVLEDIVIGKFCIKSSEQMETGLRVASCSDHASKTRAMKDCAHAIGTSNLVRNGMFIHAKRLAETMLKMNFNSKNEKPHETESYAVAGVNLAYSHASVGDHTKALHLVDVLERRFPNDINWMAARHVKICRLLVSFERAYLDCDFGACDLLLRPLLSIAPFECLMRRSLLLATEGKMEEAENLLQSFNYVDVMTKIRIQLQLASIYVTLARYEKAERELTDCAKTALTTTIRNVRAMVVRRSAVVMMVSGKEEKAVRMLLSVRQEMDTFGSVTERVLYYFQIGRCLRLLSKDPIEYLAKARLLSVQCKWKAAEKLILADTAAYYNTIGDTEKRDVVAEMFSHLDSSTKCRFVWTLI